MQQLLADPSTLPFLQTGGINLHCLKQQIDRRILNIRALLTGAHPAPALPLLCSEAIQTDPPLPEPSTNNVRLRHRRHLSSHDSNLPVESASLCQERPSLPRRKKATAAKENVGPEREHSGLRVKVTDYLTSKKHHNGPLFPHSICLSSDHDHDEDKVFTAVEFQLHNSFKTLENLREQPTSLLPFLRNRTNESDTDSDNEGTEGRKSFSTVARKRASLRKTKITERTALPEAARITATEECMRRMEEEVAKAVGRKRREPADNKLRANVIKKVEEKYGEHYDHF